jgi:hypothetical protein
MLPRSLLLGTCVVVLGAGCGGESQIKNEPEAVPETVTVVVTETAPSEGETTTATATEEETESGGGDVAGVGDVITLSGSDENLQMRVKLSKVYDPAGHEPYFGPRKGKRLVAVELLLTNTGTVVYDDSPSNGANLIDANDQGYTSAIVSSSDCADLGSPKIRPGDSRRGCITFEIPKRAKLRLFQFALDSGFAPEAGEWALN